MFLRLIFVLFTFCLITACSEDFQLTEPWKDIPVVYGIINKSDTAHYIRLEKVFVSEDIPASKISKIEDSLYYQNATVKLFNKTKNQSYSLHRVNMLDEGYVRDTGHFLTAPNYMYKIKAKDINLNAGDSLILMIDRENGLSQITSRIALVKDIVVSVPRDDTKQLAFDPKHFQAFNWSTTKGINLFSLEMNINLTQHNSAKNENTKIVLVNKLLQNDGSLSINYNNQDLFLALGSSLPQEQFYSYHIDFIELKIEGGGPELRSLLDIVNANTGITASQEIPRYSNIQPGLGIFTSVTTYKKNFTITLETLAELQTNDLTRGLNMF